MRFNYKHSIWLKIVITIFLCLFLVKDELWLIDSSAICPADFHLQVQSIFKPIIDETGWEHVSRIKMEVLLIITMAMKYGTASFQDINAALDRIYHPVLGPKRLFSVLSNIAKKNDKIFVALNTNLDQKKQTGFMIVLDAKKTDGDNFAAIDAIIPELGTDEIVCSPESLYDYFTGNPEEIAAQINEVLNTASSGKNEAVIERKKNKVKFFRRKFGNDIIWAFKKADRVTAARIFDLDLVEADEYAKPTITISSRSAEIVEGPSVHQLMKKARFQKKILTRQTIKDLITAGSREGQLLFNQANAYLSRETESVDIVIDLSLIPKADLEENMKTWAYLVLSCRDLKNVNFIFESPSFKDRTDLPKDLANTVAQAPSEAEALAKLCKAIKEKAIELRASLDIDDLLSKRISTGKRQDAIQIPITSKALLEWRGPKGIEPNQYPVALDNTNIQDRVILNNFQAALVIGLAKAAMVTAKRKDSIKEKNNEKELPELKKILLPRLQKIYNIFRKDVILTETTLDNMIDDNPLQRLNRALELVLPPIVHMQIEKLRDMHSHIQLLLQAA